MEIIKADKAHKNHVLRLLDEFRTCCMEITAPEKKAVSVRLESSSELTRAHSFYEKVGFRFYGRAYEKRL